MLHADKSAIAAVSVGYWLPTVVVLPPIEIVELNATQDDVVALAVLAVAEYFGPPVQLVLL